MCGSEGRMVVVVDEWLGVCMRQRDRKGKDKKEYSLKAQQPLI